VVETTVGFSLKTDLYDFLHQGAVKALMCKRPEIRYPIKLIRYWMCSKLVEQELRLEPSVRIAEIVIDRGQMQKWVLDCGRIRDFVVWDGFDVDIKPEVRELEYSKLIECDVARSDFEIEKSYDVFILVHFLEHLHEPEAFLSKVSAALNLGGVIIGGMPVTPERFAFAREAKIRKTATPFGHVSVFSPERIRRFADENGYEVEFLSGAFLARMSGKTIENSRVWLRFNLWFGRLFPSLGGEIYFKLRKRPV
jgi:SAM-dependent methyltransferase